MKPSLASLVLAAVVAAAAGALAAVPEPPGQRVGVRGGEPTKAGTFDGTWMYTNRDAHYALWIRTKDGKPQVRLQYQSLANPEAFETDWAGRASYYMAGKPASFSLLLDSADTDALSGRWEWELSTGSSARHESAGVRIQRTGYGRTLAMDFKDYQRTITSGPRGNVLKGPMTWTWVKVSKRELLWDELPW
jgi:hypothetical protein